MERERVGGGAERNKGEVKILNDWLTVMSEGGEGEKGITSTCYGNKLLVLLL